MNLKLPALAGFALGDAVFVWQLISIGTGLTSAFVAVATLLQLAVLLWALFQTRNQHSYVQQVGAGLLLSAVASVMVFAGCLIAVLVVFPDAIPQMQAEVTAQMQAAGNSAEEIEATMAMVAPMPQAILGVVGTMGTGLIVSGLAAMGWRKAG